jgi:hypothetical protein
MNHWVFPVGTQFFKEFSQNGKRLETRMIERVSDSGGNDDYRYAAFVWNSDETEATELPEGAHTVRGIDHIVPTVTECANCHRGETGRILGFSAMQLARGAASGDAPPVTLRTLEDRGSLSDAPNPNFAGPPGDAPTRAALGYLHANCGNCHADASEIKPATSIVLRLDVTETDPMTTALYKSNVGVRMDQVADPNVTLRISKGHPEWSGVIERMKGLGAGRMPPLATTVVDDAGIATLSTWIQSLQ